MKCKDCECFRGKRGRKGGQTECKRATRTLKGSLVYAYIDVEPDDECHYKEDSKDERCSNQKR